MNDSGYQYHFSTRHLLAFVTLLSVWFGCIARGDYLIGRSGFPLFGLASGGALFLVGKLVLNWHRHGAVSRVIIILVVLVVAYAVVFPGNVIQDYGFFAMIRQRQRAALALEEQIHDDPRFVDVSLAYVDSGQKSRWLQVDGKVPDEQSKAELTQIVETADDWHIVWDVAVASSQASLE